MTRSVKARCNPRVLLWARESSHLDRPTAAKKISSSVSPERLAQWETGESYPTVKQLRKAAKVYKRPFAIFYLPEPPPDDPGIQDFRRPRESGSSELSPGLAMAIRSAYLRRNLALELFSSLGEEVSTFPVKARLDDDVAELGSNLRSILRVDQSTQSTWRQPSVALKHWRLAVERLDVLVFQMTRIPFAEARGFSIPDDVLPVIALNSADSPAGRIFTLFHEVGHIMLRESGICNPLWSNGQPSSRRNVEAFCNRFAAEFLVPLEALRNHNVVRKKAKNGIWDQEELAELSNEYAVSREMLLYRLKDTRLIAKSSFNSLLANLKKEQAAKPVQEAGGGPTQPQACVLRNGPTFTELVLAAYDRDLLPANKASEYLSIPAYTNISPEQFEDVGSYLSAWHDEAS